MFSDKVEHNFEKRFKERFYALEVNFTMLEMNQRINLTIVSKNENNSLRIIVYVRDPLRIPKERED